MAEDQTIPETRAVLQRIAAHVLGRRRYEVTGRFGLRAMPAGFGTPAFGEDVEVLRVAGAALVRERAGNVAAMPIDGASLRALAGFAGTELGAPFSVGDDTPPLGDPDARLAVDADAAAAIASWFDLGWRALDVVTVELGPGAATAVQLWPEHFDAACSVTVGPGENDRCTLGASPGDSFSAEAYLYLGPWTDERPGDPGFWNAPFGAVLPRSAVIDMPDPLAAAAGFLRRGLMLQTVGD